MVEHGGSTRSKDDRRGTAKGFTTTATLVINNSNMGCSQISGLSTDCPSHRILGSTTRVGEVVVWTSD